MIQKQRQQQQQRQQKYSSLFKWKQFGMFHQNIVVVTIGYYCCLLILFLQCVTAFKYQVDTNDNCQERILECHGNANNNNINDNNDSNDNQVPVWFECPVTCNEQFHQEGSMFEVSEDPEQFFSEYSVNVVASNNNNNNNKVLSLDDFEGYVTIYAVIPLKQSTSTTSAETTTTTTIQDGGMAQFYYELLEHVQAVYPYTVQTLIEPYRVIKTSNNNDNDTTTTSTTSTSSTSSIIPHDKPKTILLQENTISLPLSSTSSSSSSSLSSLSPVLNYLVTTPTLTAGNPNVQLHWDRVTIFLVSADGMFVERLLSPSMSLLERRVAVFLKQLEWSPEL